MEDIRAFETFFTYKLTFDEDALDILDDILKKASKYLSSKDLEAIKKAYEFAKNAHAWTLRQSWEPYIVHPLKATQFLMEINPDIVSIQACLLHDVIEDTKCTHEEIEQLFGKETADICEGLVKVSGVRYKWEDRDLETVKKTFLAMAKDLRVIFIKFVDRIHNVQTLQYLPDEFKRKKIAEETLKIYAPVAKRLWLYMYQLYLENGSFRILYPERFLMIMEYIKKYFGTGERFIDRGIKSLTSILKKEGLSHFTIQWRIKSPFRIFEKMEKKYNTSDVSMIMDLLAFRVITDTVTDCYMILGIIHKYYTPLIKKIKDYIALPKFNGYKSIHTTILGMFRFPIEIQIRTWAMNEIAEHGVAAHYAYAEHNKSVVASSNQVDWIQRLQVIVADYTESDNKEKFKDALNIEILDKAIFVYTPKGDIKELPQGSSVLDFAFSIHSEIWLRFKNAIVNGQIKPLSYVLRTGDIVNINTFKNRYSAVKHWLDYLHTPSARGQLIKYIRIQEREVRLDEAIEWLNTYLKNLWLPQFRWEKDLIQKLGDPLEVERRILLVLDKQETYGSIVRSAYPALTKALQEKTVASDEVLSPKDAKQPPLTPLPWVESMDVIVDNDKRLHCIFCPECKPHPEDKIIAKSGKDGIKIHTIHCKALKTLSYTSLLEAHWQSDAISNTYTIHAELQFSKTRKSMVDIIALFNTFSIPIFKFELAKLDDKYMLALIEGEVSNPAKLSFLFADLQKNQTSLSVVSKKVY